MVQRSTELPPCHAMEDFVPQSFAFGGFLILSTKHKALRLAIPTEVQISMASVLLSHTLYDCMCMYTDVCNSNTSGHEEKTSGPT